MEHLPVIAEIIATGRNGNRNLDDLDSLFTQERATA
jgi:hypothetical protein